MTENAELDMAGLVAAFHLMWDNYPAPCTLVHASREVIAVNPACDGIGRKPGMICSRHGPPENHRGCLADRALAEHAAQSVRKTAHGTERITFWLPIDGFADYYVHFSVLLDTGTN